MKKYTVEELKSIIESHALWLAGEGGQRANLTRADLSGANLSGANLTGADLSGADLSGANLSGANLSGADLSGADLSGADLSGANLTRASLTRASLTRANLSGANLSGANLTRASLTGADLSGLLGNTRHVKTLATETWVVTYTATVMQIGCQRHPIGEWFSFNDDQISDMSPNALDWWHKWRDVLKTIIELSPAEPTGAGCE